MCWFLCSEEQGTGKLLEAHEVRGGQPQTTPQAPLSCTEENAINSEVGFGTLLHSPTCRGMVLLKASHQAGMKWLPLSPSAPHLAWPELGHLPSSGPA